MKPQKEKCWEEIQEVFATHTLPIWMHRPMFNVAWILANLRRDILELRAKYYLLKIKGFFLDAQIAWLYLQREAIYIRVFFWTILGM